MTGRRKSRATEVIQQLERDIVTGALKPGDRIDERQLSERFNVSRTPVREALLHLASTGLVTALPRRGTVVASITISDLIEMFEVMAEMESHCARLAARRMLRDDVARLQALHEACTALIAEDDPDAYYAANVTFHEAIYAGARNSFLERQTKALRNRLSPYRRLQLHRQGRLERSNTEHGNIVQAIRDGDEERAAAETRQHVNVQGQALNDLIAIIPRSFITADAGAAER